MLRKILFGFIIILFTSCGIDHTDFEGKWINKKRESDSIVISKNGNNYIVKHKNDKYPANINNDLLEISAQLPLKATIDKNEQLIVMGEEYVRPKIFLEIKVENNALSLLKHINSEFNKKKRTLEDIKRFIRKGMPYVDESTPYFTANEFANLNEQWINIESNYNILSKVEKSNIDNIIASQKSINENQNAIIKYLQDDPISDLVKISRYIKIIKRYDNQIENLTINYNNLIDQNKSLKLPKYSTDFLTVSNKVSTTKNHANINNEVKKGKLEYSIIGEYRGTLGNKPITIKIEYLNGGEIKGYNEVKGNRRPIQGNYKKQNDKFIVSLNEPGNHKWDGVFNLTFTNKENFIQGFGTWKSFNGKLNRIVNINN